MLRNLVWGAVCGSLTIGCAAQPASDTQEIIDNLVAAGFPSNDIRVVHDVVYVGRDAQVSLEASREMLASDASHEEQYRTNNLISTSLTKICIDGSTFTGVFSTALDLAIENYDEQPLTFAMARTPSTGCSFTINGVIAPGMVGGVSGFPANGLPFNTINIGDGLSTFSVDTIEHVITHEIGHTIGFRHSDFFNRAISCGGGASNEGDGGVGATLIPGTPSTAVVGGSIMNSCFRPVETGEFTASDLISLNWLYGASNGLSGLVHISGIGDQTFQQNQFAGTRGQSRSLEGYQIRLSPEIPGVSLTYMAHLSGTGDTAFVGEGQFVGTRGQSRQMEGFAIRLTGVNAANFTVEYMAHLAGTGDTVFFRDGQFAGTRGESRGVQGMLVRVRPR